MRLFHALIYHQSSELAKVINYKLEGFEHTLLWDVNIIKGGVPYTVCLYLGPGERGDYLTNPLSRPICSDRLVHLIHRRGASGVQILEFRLLDANTERPVEGYRLVNVLTKIEALDIAQSQLSRDENGRISAVFKIAVSPEKVSKDVHIFRLSEWPYAIIVSDALAQDFVGKGLRGLAFERL